MESLAGVFRGGVFCVLVCVAVLREVGRRVEEEGGEDGGLREEKERMLAVTL